MCTGRSAVLGHGRCQPLSQSNSDLYRDFSEHPTITAGWSPTSFLPSCALRRFAQRGQQRLWQVQLLRLRWCVSPWQAQAARSWGNPSPTLQTGMFRLAQSNDWTQVVGMGEVTDGTSNTIMMGEVTESYRINPTTTNWMFPLWAGGNNDQGGMWRMNSWGDCAVPSVT